jgi:hypothetical protein
LGAGGEIEQIQLTEAAEEMIGIAQQGDAVASDGKWENVDVWDCRHFSKDYNGGKIVGFMNNDFDLADELDLNRRFKNSSLRSE